MQSLLTLAVLAFTLRFPGSGISTECSEHSCYFQVHDGCGFDRPTELVRLNGVEYLNHDVQQGLLSQMNGHSASDPVVGS